MVILRSKVATNGLPCVVSRFNAQTMYQVGSMNRTISIVLSEMRGGQVLRLSEVFTMMIQRIVFFQTFPFHASRGVSWENRITRERKHCTKPVM